MTKFYQYFIDLSFSFSFVFLSISLFHSIHLVFFLHISSLYLSPSRRLSRSRSSSSPPLFLSHIFLINWSIQSQIAQLNILFAWKKSNFNKFLWKSQLPLYVRANCKHYVPSCLCPCSLLNVSIVIEKLHLFSTKPLYIEYFSGFPHNGSFL